MALEIGAAGRQTVIEQFGQERFLKEWNEVLYKVANCPPGGLD